MLLNKSNIFKYYKEREIKHLALLIEIKIQILIKFRRVFCSVQIS